MNQYPEKLRLLRGKRSSLEVSTAIGISRSALQMYEAGLRKPRDEVKKRIADYYGTTVQEIFFD